MITLGGVDYPSVYCATGARGFYGEGYPFHRYWRFLGMDWTGTGFSGKTLTFLPRRGSKHTGPDGKPEKGNMELKSDGVTPVEMFPKCIYVNLASGEIINAVGLSNFGMEFYLGSGMYHRLEEPFFISVALDAVGDSEQEAEIIAICDLLKRFMPFKAPFALQVNYGCPNSGHDLSSFYNTMANQVGLFKSLLEVPVFVNTNALMPLLVLKEVSMIADGLWIGNTIPWRAPETINKIDWDARGNVSPLRLRGIEVDGGLSSHSCLQFTLDLVAGLRDSGVSIPIIAGNGIRTVEDVRMLKRVGADGMFICSLAVVRPWSMKKVISCGNDVFR